MSSAQHKAVASHRRRQRDRGVVRVEVQAPETDAALLREVAAALRGEPERARAVRTTVREALRRPARSMLDLLACDLADDVVDEALARPRELPRDVSP